MKIEDESPWSMKAHYMEEFDKVGSQVDLMEALVNKLQGLLR